MQIGTIIRWANFPIPQYGGRRKPRWFLCLGITRQLNQPKRFYFHSTTKTIRPSINHFPFKKVKYNFFAKDCYLYFNEPPYLFSRQELGIPEIMAVGKIDKADLGIIYEGIRKEQRYSRMELLDIYNCFNLNGIIGINKP